MEVETAVILFGCLVLFALLYIGYHYMRLSKFAFHKPAHRGNFSEPVSIIICARNEYQALQEIVPAILKQNYPKFEVVIVDDASWDKTGELIEQWEASEPRIKAVYITEDMKRMDGKKLALTLGVKAAKYDIFLFTDADCIPASENWIAEMVNPYHREQVEMVIGYSPYRKQPGLLNLLIQMETLFTATSYFSYALAGTPYMGVGRNLSYRKTLFFKHKGFASHHHIAAGDDDLFVRDAATKNNTAVCYVPLAFMTSNPKQKFMDWFRQKKRHLFVGKYYKAEHKRSLGFFALLHLLFWTLLIVTLCLKPVWWWALIVLGVVWIANSIVIFNAFKKLQQPVKVIWLPLFDILFIPYNMVFGVVSLFSRQKKW